jgi:hypothetical protein
MRALFRPATRHCATEMHIYASSSFNNKPTVCMARQMHICILNFGDEPTLCMGGQMYIFIFMANPLYAIMHGYVIVHHISIHY